MMTDDEKAYNERADMILNALEDWAKTNFYFSPENDDTVGHGFRLAQETVAKVVRKRYDA
jgi:hypothetical protein